MVPLMPLTVTMFLEAVGCVIAGGDECVGVTAGVSRDDIMAQGASLGVSSYLTGVWLEESTKYDVILLCIILLCHHTDQENINKFTIAYI